MTSLHEEMRTATRDAHPDLSELVASARRDGMGLRRRRQALSALGAAAAVTALALALPPLVQGPDADRSSTPATSTAPAKTPSKVTYSARAVAALLRDAVIEQAPGTATGFAAQTAAGEPPGEVHARFMFTPADASAATMVQINVQPFFGPTPTTCSASWMSECTITRRGNARVMTYLLASSGPAVDRAVEVRRGPDFRLLVATTNRTAYEKGVVVRAQPPLTPEQLTAIALNPAWGELMDPTYEAEGAQLTPFRLIPND